MPYRTHSRERLSNYNLCSEVGSDGTGTYLGLVFLRRVFKLGVDCRDPRSLMRSFPAVVRRNSLT